MGQAPCLRRPLWPPATDNVPAGGQSGRRRLRACPTVAFSLLLAGCTARPPDFSQRTGVIELPAGTIELHRELTVAEGAHHLEIRGSASGTSLRAASDFVGRALIYAKGATDLRLTGFRIEGNRAALEKPIGLPTGDVPFARYYLNNGIVIESATHLSIRDVSFREVANYPLLVSASNGVRIDRVTIEDCGSLSPTGHNNASGGILLEEGTRDFEVRQATLRRVRGNGIWTHSFYHSPRNANGVIAENIVEEVARDAIQVGQPRTSRSTATAAAASDIRWNWWISRHGPCPWRSTPPGTWINPITRAITSKTSTESAWTSTASTMVKSAIIPASAASPRANIRGHSSVSCSITRCRFGIFRRGCQRQSDRRRGVTAAYTCSVFIKRSRTIASSTSTATNAPATAPGRTAITVPATPRCSIAASTWWRARRVRPARRITRSRITKFPASACANIASRLRPA